jgi:hypothetical protein
MDALIRMFDPDLDFPKISHKRPSKRGTLFGRGVSALVLTDG